MGSKNRNQCFQHYHDILDPTLNRQPFNTEETDFLCTLYSEGFHSPATIKKFFQFRSTAIIRTQMRKLDLIIGEDLITIVQYEMKLKMKEMREKRLMEEDKQRNEFIRRSQRFARPKQDEILEPNQIEESDIISDLDSCANSKDDIKKDFFREFWEEMEQNKAVSKYHRRYSEKHSNFVFA